MKKFFTLIFALMGFAVAANASTVDDIKVCKHSYVFDCAAYAEVGRTKGSLFADDYFLDVTGGSVGTKGCVNAFEKLGDAYADYNTTPTKSLRLKNAQDVIAMRITAGSKLIILGESHASRSPEINNQADMKGTSLDYYLANTKDTEGKFEWTAPDDMLIYIGSHGGDYFISWIIVEANEAPGTPQVKVGNQEFVNGLWYKEVTVKPALAYGMETEVYYTTDGTAPTAESTKYTEPIKCYAPTALKFQAFVMGSPVPDAENEVSVNFSFDAPTITADGAAVTITSPYEGAKNFYAVNDGEAVEGSSFTLEESAKVSAYSQIVNGTYATFTSLPTSKEVYVLNPIKVKQTLTVTGDIVENPDKKAETDPNYIVENGAITHDKKFFYVRNDSYKVVEEAEYQVPAGQQAYLMMSGDNITFEVAEGDSVDVVVTCSKNACKNINLTDEEVDAEGSKVANDRKCFINVDGTNYSAVDAEGNEAADLKRNPDANIVKFGLKAGIHTFKKYSGTGNILVSSIEITPVEATGIQNVKNAAEAQDGAIYNLAGQKVDAAFKGLVIKNGKKMIQK